LALDSFSRDAIQRWALQHRYPLNPKRQHPVHSISYVVFGEGFECAQMSIEREGDDESRAAMNMIYFPFVLLLAMPDRRNTESLVGQRWCDRGCIAFLADQSQSCSHNISNASGGRSEETASWSQSI
jgi:hypothetical protein